MAGNTKSRKKQTPPRRAEKPRPPRQSDFPISQGDIRPDPALLSSAERLAEFGRLMVRAIERRRARRSA
jgi:hypothetical protein